MARPIYPYELGDPDFSWLVSSFLENNPEYGSVENGCLPVVFIKDLKRVELQELPTPEMLDELAHHAHEPVLDDQEC